MELYDEIAESIREYRKSFQMQGKAVPDMKIFMSPQALADLRACKRAAARGDLTWLANGNNLKVLGQPIEIDSQHGKWLVTNL